MMKKCLFIIVVLSTFLDIKSYAGQTLNPLADTTQKQLPDGIYYANVAYYNYATFVNAEYTLKVRVKDGMVIIIHLNNGGVVHYGINNENYMYTGGKLGINRKNNKLDYSTQVSISNGRDISSYTINILKEARDEAE